MAETPAGDPQDEGPTVQVLGAQRTGSTWLETLVERNLTAGRIGQGGRHRPHDGSSADAYLVTIKDPWAWLVSFYKFQLHPVYGIVDRVWNRILHPPVDKFRAARWWNMYLLSYERWRRDLPEDRTAWLRYEELLPDPRPELGKALESVGVPHRSPLESDTVHRADFASPLAKIYSPSEARDRSFDPTYYTEKRYLDAYRPDQMRTIFAMAKNRGYVERFRALGYDLAEDLIEA